MKKRPVMLIIELVSGETIEDLKDCIKDNLEVDLPGTEVLQIQENVIQSLLIKQEKKTK